MKDDKNLDPKNRMNRLDRRERIDLEQNQEIDNVEFGADFFDDISVTSDRNENENWANNLRNNNRNK